MQPDTDMLLAGDIGATKTSLALYRISTGPKAPPLREMTFQNALFADFDQLLQAVIQQGPVLPAYACLGVAGPVIAGRVHMTNLNWSIDADQLCQTYGFSRVALINDLVATALGATHLPEADLHTLNKGRRRPGAVMAVLAPGSGLGEAFLVPFKESYHPFPSEGGHASFAPRNEEQADLLAFLRRRQGHVSVEQVCSGLAIPDLFAFMAQRHPVPDDFLAGPELAAGQTPAIIRAALQARRGGPPCLVAVRTLTLFADILADEAANLVLKTLALGGLFLGGGLAPRLMPFLEPERFMATFVRGGYADMLSQVPIHVILNPQAALLGAAVYGMRSCADPDW